MFFLYHIGSTFKGVGCTFLVDQNTHALLNCVAYTLVGFGYPVKAVSDVVDLEKGVFTGTDLVPVVAATSTNAGFELSTKNCLENRPEGN